MTTAEIIPVRQLGFGGKFPADRIVTAQLKDVASPTIESVVSPENQSGLLTDIDILKKISNLRKIRKKRVVFIYTNGNTKKIVLPEDLIITRKILKGNRYSYYALFSIDTLNGKSTIIPAGTQIKSFSKKEMIPKNKFPELILKLRERMKSV